MKPSQLGDCSVSIFLNRAITRAKHFFRRLHQVFSIFLKDLQEVGEIVLLFLQLDLNMKQLPVSIQCRSFWTSPLYQLILPAFDCPSTSKKFKNCVYFNSKLKLETLLGFAALFYRAELTPGGEMSGNGIALVQQ
jgi:hypothetical protein